MRKNIIILSTIWLLAQAGPVMAQIPSPCSTPSCGLNDPLNGADIPTFVGRVIQNGLPLIGALMLIMFLYGGFLYLTAAGNSEDTKKAVTVLRNAIIGMGIVVLSYALVFTIINKLAASLGK